MRVVRERAMPEASSVGGWRMGGSLSTAESSSRNELEVGKATVASGASI